MRRLLYLTLFATCANAFAGPATLSAGEWARPRSGEALVAWPALSAVVQEYLASADGTLRIRYPGGDEGSLWAREVRAWLVALGIASDRIELMPGSADADRIELDVLPAE